MNWVWGGIGALLMALVGCDAAPATPAAAAAAPGIVTPIAAWQPVDPAFAGCAGACGAHVEEAPEGVVAQPGAAIGQRTFCPVSGAVFEIAATHQHADVNGERVWFCCEGCLRYFEEHRAEVLRARGMGAQRRGS